jgi:SAM-dependent methyltransferase
MASFGDLSSFYDLDYADTSDHGFLRALVRAVDPGHLLEIPCGSGRNVAPLLESSSRRVTFMDIAQTMVRQASGRIPPSQRSRATAAEGDIRAIGMAGEFDLVICPREAFQLLCPADAARALGSLAASTARGGLVVIDLFSFTRATPSPPDAPPDYFVPADHDWRVDWTRSDAGRGLTVTRRRRQRFTPAGVHFEMRYTLRAHGGARPRQIGLEFDMTNYSQTRLRQMAERAGLDVLAAFAGYGGLPRATSASLRTVFVLGHHRDQQAGERLDRFRGQVAAGRPAADQHGPDAR